MTTKKQNKRISKKRGIRTFKWNPLDWDWPWAKRDTIRAARRKWGDGAGK